MNFKAEKKERGALKSAMHRANSIELPQIAESWVRSWCNKREERENRILKKRMRK
jgi:hypothetical protein